MKVSAIPTVNNREESVLTKHDEPIALINAALNIKKEDGYLYSRSLLSTDMPASIVEQELSCRGLLVSEPRVKQQTLGDYFKFEDKLNSVLQVANRFVPRGTPTLVDDVVPIKTKGLKKYHKAQSHNSEGTTMWCLKLYPKEAANSNIDEQFIGKQQVFRDVLLLEILQKAIQVPHPKESKTGKSKEDEQLGFPSSGIPSQSNEVKPVVHQLPEPSELSGFLQQATDEVVTSHFFSLFTNHTRVSVSGLSCADFKKLNTEYKQRLVKSSQQGVSEHWSRSELQLDHDHHQKLWQVQSDDQSVYCCSCNALVSPNDIDKCSCASGASNESSRVVLELTSVSSEYHTYSLKVKLNDHFMMFYTNLTELGSHRVSDSKQAGSKSGEYGSLQTLQLLHAYFSRLKLLQAEVLFVVFHTVEHFLSGTRPSTVVNTGCVDDNDVDFLDLISLSDLECTLGTFENDKHSPIGTSSGVTGCSGSSGCSPDSSIIAAVVDAGAHLESRREVLPASVPVELADSSAVQQQSSSAAFAEDPELVALLKDLEEDGDEPLVNFLTSGGGGDLRLPSDASSLSDNDQLAVKADTKPAVRPSAPPSKPDVTSAASSDSEFVSLMQRGRILAGCQFDLNLSNQLQNLAPGGKSREFVVNLMKMWLNFGRDNILKLCRGYVSGVSLPCLSMMGVGAWSGPREEYGRFHQVDVNLGPAVCQWFAIDGTHVRAFSHFMINKYSVDVMTQNGNWFPSIQMLSEANIPFRHGFQRPGSVMSIQGSTLSWKRSLGFAQHLCWTVAYLDYAQIASSIQKQLLVQHRAFHGLPSLSTVPLQTLLHDVLQILRHMESKVKPAATVVVQKEKGLFLDQCKLSKFVLRHGLENTYVLSQLLLYLLRKVYRLTKLVDMVRKCCKVKPAVDINWMVTHCSRSDCNQEVFEVYVQCEACGNVCLPCALKRCQQHRHQCETDWNGYFAVEVDSSVPIVERCGTYRMRHADNSLLYYKAFEGQTLEDKLSALQKLFSDMKEHWVAELYRTSRDAAAKEKHFKEDMSKVKKEVGKELNEMFGCLLAGRWK